jgi:hypothetical protein
MVATLGGASLNCPLPEATLKDVIRRDKASAGELGEHHAGEEGHGEEGHGEEGHGSSFVSA